MLSEVEMNPIQVNAGCMVWDGDKRVLVRTSTSDSIYAVFAYPEMRFLNYTGNQSEFVTPLVEYDKAFSLVNGDSLYIYELTNDNQLEKKSVHFLCNWNYRRVLGLKRMNNILYVYSGSSDDAGLNEFFVLNAETHTLSSKGRYPESSTSRFKSISDFKFAYAHGVWPKPDGDRILVSYIRTRRFRIYDMDFRLLHDVCLDYASNKYVVDAEPNRWTTFIEDCFVTDKYIYLLCPEGEKSSLVIVDWEGRPIARYRLDEKIFFFFIDSGRNLFCGINSNHERSFYFLDLDIN